MTTIHIDELVKDHLEHFDCFIPVFDKHGLDVLTLDCQLSDSVAYLEVIVPEDGKPGATMLANKIQDFGFTFTSSLSSELKRRH